MHIYRIIFDTWKHVLLISRTFLNSLNLTRIVRSSRIRKNRRYSLSYPRPEVISRVGESTSRHSGGFFSAFTRGRATQILTMTFIAVMRNGPQTGSSSCQAHSVSDNFSNHANRVLSSECKSLRKGRVLSKRSHQFHYQDTWLRIITRAKNVWRNNFCVYNDIIKSIKCLTGNFVVTSRYQLIHDNEQKRILDKK